MQSTHTQNSLQSLFRQRNNQEGKQVWRRRLGTEDDEKTPAMLTIDYVATEYLLEDISWEEHVNEKYTTHKDPFSFVGVIFTTLEKNLQAQSVKITLTTYPSDDHVVTFSKSFTVKKSKKRKHIDDDNVND